MIPDPDIEKLLRVMYPTWSADTLAAVVADPKDEDHQIALRVLEWCRAHVDAGRREMRDQAAKICAQSAIKLISNGRARTNQFDRHVADVLRRQEAAIAALPVERGP